jgi:hypothetical protein
MSCNASHSVQVPFSWTAYASARFSMCFKVLSRLFSSIFCCSFALKILLETFRKFCVSIHSPFYVISWLCLLTALDPRLCVPGLRRVCCYRTNKTSLVCHQARQDRPSIYHLRRPGYLGCITALDPRLCVPAFRRVCFYRILITYIIAIRYRFSLFIPAN